MFGRLLKNIIPSAVLFGFCAYIIKLYFEDSLNLYIHPRYTFFSLIMSVIAIIILVCWLIVSLRRKVVAEKMSGSRFIDITTVIILGLALFLPAQALSQQTIRRKAVNAPSYAHTSLSSSECPSEGGNTIQEWVYYLSEFPSDCFVGKRVSVTGYVTSSQDYPLSEDLYLIGRTVIACCIVDARPYVLTVKKDNFPSYSNDTWLNIEGTFTSEDVLGQMQLVIVPDSVRKTINPDKPYEYVSTPLDNLNESKDIVESYQ